MPEFIKIKVDKAMKDDMEECEAMAKRGEEKECAGCSLNGGEYIGCLADHEWHVGD